MPEHPTGNPNARGLADAIREHDFQLTEYHVPVLTSGMPMLHDPLGRQVQHPAQGIIVGKRRLVLCDLSELPVETLNDIGRVYDSTNLQRIFKKGAQNLPVFLPAFDTGRVLFPPTLCKAVEITFRFLQSDGCIDFFSNPLQPA